MHQRIIMLVLASAALLCLVSCGNQESAKPKALESPAAETAPPPQALPVADKGKAEPKKSDSANVVTIDNFAFTPQELSVPVNSTVTWINHDDIPHTVKDTQKHF